MTTDKSIFPPWPTFVPVNDTVRGGKSSSNLQPPTAAHPHAAVFDGHLDITALGVAGFASQSHSFPASSPLSLPRNHYSGLQTTILIPASFAENEPTSFLLSVKNETPNRREDGRRESVTSFEFSFDVRELAEQHEPGAKIRSSSQKKAVLFMKWSAFEATYRGRTLPKDDPATPILDPSKIMELSFMCRSNFGKQQGDFYLEIVSVEAVQEESLEGEDEKSWAREVASGSGGFVAALWIWCRSTWLGRVLGNWWYWMSGKEGSLRLP